MTLTHTQVELSTGSLHVVDTQGEFNSTVLFLHGWPQSWRAWEPVMQLAAPEVRAIAIDLPGVGGSVSAATDGSTRAIADVIGQLIEAMQLTNVTLVGQDLGGMVAYHYLRSNDDIQQAVVLNTVIPGVAPWDTVLANPYIWHFAFHSVPAMPELLVHGKQAAYFDYFYDVLAAHPERITTEARHAHAAAYASPAALTAGFDWYRKLSQDAADNRSAATTSPASTPLLYLRGDREPGEMTSYVEGFSEAGIENLEYGTIPDAGHFSPEEAPAAVWALIRDFVAPTRS